MLTPLRLLATSASLSPATSSTKATRYGMFRGAESPRAKGLDPSAPKSSSRAMKAVLMSAPESNRVHLMFAGEVLVSDPDSRLTVLQARMVDGAPRQHRHRHGECGGEVVQSHIFPRHGTARRSTARSAASITSPEMPIEKIPTSTTGVLL
ncbi:Uncharacterised protein [Mycobacteroides abscessus subsp. abscessus]|nr:Uncharacterised protein [Mycobacteroides abscessus subsp. abscessus]